MSDAILALIAELYQGSARLQAELDAERAAHAETRAALAEARQTKQGPTNP